LSDTITQKQSNRADGVGTGASRRGLVTLGVIVLLVAAIVAAVGIVQRRQAQAALETFTNANAAPAVALVQPKLQQSANQIVLPGNMQAYTLAPIYARTTGYVKAWYHDIGSHVRRGDLLAVIETPELDQQLAQAKADLTTAQSNEALAKVTANRYQGLLQQNAVSQQDTDNALAQLQARTAEVSSAQANVRRLQELVSFEKVVAPFDGVVTARNLDIGQLVTSAGSTTTPGTGIVTNSKPMFEVSALNKLRVYVSVPQVYAPDAKTGAVANLTLPQFPGKSFKGKLVRTADAVDPATRTLLAEIRGRQCRGRASAGKLHAGASERKQSGAGAGDSRKRGDSGAGWTARCGRGLQQASTSGPCDAGPGYRCRDRDPRRA